MAKYFRYSFLKCRALFHNLLPGIFIFIVPFSIQAQEKEPPTSCRELTSPNNQTEVNELLSCIRALNRERNSQRDLLKIQNNLSVPSNCRARSILRIQQPVTKSFHPNNPEPILGPLFCRTESKPIYRKLTRINEIPPVLSSRERGTQELTLVQ